GGGGGRGGGGGGGGGGRGGEGETNGELRITNYESPIPNPQSLEAYCLVRPQILLVATGARERSLVFRGNTLPGVYGAGAFQTLVNRDLVKAANRLFIVGGGNVGLIAGYHALQAGIEVVGLVEALPECGGYKVHKDKLVRMGVPIYTSHTVLSANGTEQVESVTIAQVDAQFRPIPGTEKSFACDTVLIAVGLESVNEFTAKAREYGLPVFDAGDAEEIAEASAAMFSGKIRGREIARALGADVDAAPDDWYHTAEVLKSKPGAAIPERIPEQETGVMPVFHCSQEIPCNPCTSVCPQQLIHIDPDDIRALPDFLGPQVGKTCLGCEKCVTICPGLAITLLDYRKDAAMPTVTLAYEFQAERLHTGDRVTVLDSVGGVLGEVEVTDVRAIKRNDRTVVVKVRAPREIARRIAGIRVQEPWVSEALEHVITRVDDDEIVCRCERVTAGEIRALIRKGYRDMNEIKAVTRAGMGACGGKTCTSLILRLFREEGVPPSDVTPNVKRPLFVEAPLGVFANGEWRITNYEWRMANGEAANQRISGSADRRIGESADRWSGGSAERRIGEAASSQSPIPNPQSPPPPSTVYRLPSTYDVIVIGAGSVGAPAALALAQAGVKTLVLDQFASQGQGSQKAAIGGVRATHSDPAKIRLCLRSLEIFSTWEEVYGHNLEWTTGGYSFVAYREQDEATLKSLLKVQHAYGLDIDWHDRDALLEIAPALNPEGLIGGTYSSGDGHCSTLLAGHAFYDAAKQAGATFQFNEPVREILVAPQMTGAHRHIVGVRTDRGDYHALVVINAAGSWAGEVGALVGLRHPILSEAHEGGITEPVAHFLNPLMVDIRPAPGSKNYYFFQLRSGQVVFCITPEPPIPGFDRRETSEFLPLIAPRMVDLMPRLAAIRVRRTWRGLYPMTPDGAPIVGWARELEGYLMAVGMCGQGFMLGPGLGELLARMVTQQTTESDAEILQVLSPYRAFAGQEALK
ncbi:MAG TPA: FAD-dependent oxidoreductase, partial [Anaerolineae bacterium]|nr:FAD-dependent oxidoreductase [Anaerolineae bacterium]